MKDTTAQEGLGPIFGKPVPMKLIIASKDLVAADAVTSNIMGYKPEEVKIEGLPPYTVIEDEKACTGCKATLVSALMDMKAQHLEYLLEGKTIVVGPVPEDKIPKDIKKEDLILMGVCTRPYWDRGTPAKGCPPNNAWTVQAIAGDRIQYGTRYATDKEEEK